jgi:hypothetical protein
MEEKSRVDSQESGVSERLTMRHRPTSPSFQFHKPLLTRTYLKIGFSWKTVMPAKAGIQKDLKNWIPACAGMTIRSPIRRYGNFEIGSHDL